MTVRKILTTKTTPTKPEDKVQKSKILAQKARERSQTTNNQPRNIKDQAENESKKAESEAKRAEAQAVRIEILAKRAAYQIEEHTYKAKVADDKVAEYMQLAAIETEARKKYEEAQEAKVKAKKIVARTYRRLKNKLNNESFEKEVKSEDSKIEKELREAQLKAKKAKILVQQASEANEAQIKYVSIAKEAKRKALAFKLEAEERQAEANARKAEARARRAEARARRDGDNLKAEAYKAEAGAQKAKALTIRAVIEKRKAEERTRRLKQKETSKVALLVPEIDCPQKQTRLAPKKHLSAAGLLNCVSDVFKNIKDPIRKTRGPEAKITLCDHLMSGLAVFGLKYSSLLQFVNDGAEGGCIRHNLRTLYQVEHAPDDTYMRERLDLVDPFTLRRAFTKVFAKFQRGKELERYVFYEGHYLASGDASGYFASEKVHCENCCKKEHQDGRVTYYHQMMSAAIVHPNFRTVIPFCPEPIIKGDGSTKNDCERNASERLYRHIRREHPHLKLIITEDALGSNGPHLRLLKELNMRFIIVAKPDGNKFIFEFLKNIEPKQLLFEDDRYRYKIHYVNGIPLNDSHRDLEVNFIEMWAYDKTKNKEYHNTWITDIHITEENAFRLCQGGRAKWKIENETFNTLKNQGYNFEHNYGHGTQNLSSVFAMLMFLAFLIDQIQQTSCGQFQAAFCKMKSKVRLWHRIRACCTTLLIDSWETLWNALAFGSSPGDLILSEDTS